ncbi:metal-dependent hydrolase [uncultured Sphingomonas sp.]|uniref:metal-dependent hydrolase n=1 Tax=uncultured Sphingomonas sp. TaxID=158754 RepID=UPI0025F0420A|nr:metal-dependent hydrolase [uncultured Sphingomonas sp.]
MSKAKTPADLTITPRDVRFGRGGSYRRYWLNDDPIATAFYNALSVTFPKGEGFFIDSVRQFRDDVPPRLAAEIRAFIKQEAIHTREHVAFNRHVADQRYDTSRLEARVDHELAITRGKPPIANLAATMALEHFTAILAHELVANPRHLAGGDQDAADLWRWHAIEEIEHKGVAYDTWLHATRDWTRLKRWWVKTLVMLIVTAKFFRGRTVGMLDLLAQDGLTGARVKWRLFAYAFGRPGMARKVMGMWLSFFLPGFHPWNHDDRELIGLVDSEFEAARLASA